MIDPSHAMVTITISDIDTVALRAFLYVGVAYMLFGIVDHFRYWMRDDK